MTVNIEGMAIEVAISESAISSGVSRASGFGTADELAASLGASKAGHWPLGWLEA